MARWYFIILLLLTTSLCQQVEAQSFVIDGLKYTYQDDGTVSVGATDSTGEDVVIPKTVIHNGREVTVSKLDDAAFFDRKQVKTVIILSEIKEIPWAAFHRCPNLVKVELPETIEVIGNDAFYNCGLRHINLPEGLQMIKQRAFSDTKIEHVSIPNTATILLNEIFGHCLELETAVIPDGIEEIPYCTFLECTLLREVSIGNSVIKIHDGAFSNCPSLDSIYIPKSVEEISLSAFSHHNLQRIIVDEDNKTYDSRDNCNAIIESSNNTMILGCTKSSIPKDVTKLYRAFQEIPDIYSVTIPNHIIYLNYAYYGCESLEEVIIEDGEDDLYTNYPFSNGLLHSTIQHSTTVKSLYCGRNIFPSTPLYIDDHYLPLLGYFTNLEELIIGEQVNRLFMEGCKHNVSVYAKSMSPSHFDFSFGDDTEAVFESATLYVPKGTRELYMATDGWNRFLNIVEYDATSISSVRSASDSKAIYNINGHRLASPQKGIYIQNGKKHVVK